MAERALAARPSRPLRILLVDPDATFRSVLSAYLAAHGFEVAAWADGRQALARLHELKPELVLTDLDSDDFDGLELAEAIARLPDAPKVALCTRLSAAGAWDRDALAAIGICDVIIRPITFPLLTDRLRGLLRAEAPPASALPAVVPGFHAESASEASALTAGPTGVRPRGARGARGSWQRRGQGRS